MDDDQQFCLRWNNHQSTLVSVFDNLLENGTLVDCTLFAEGKFLKAHKVVLSACSPYFESLLTQQYDKHPIFILKDVKFQELKAMMDYMYRGEVNISQDQLAALLKAAESLQIKGLSDSRSSKSDNEPPRKSAPPPPPAKTPPPAPTIPRVQGLTIEQRKTPKLSASDIIEDSRSREGSASPLPRKRKKPKRRTSQEGLNDNHDASNSSESHSNQAPTPNIPSSSSSTPLPTGPLASTSKITADVPEPPIETKSEIVTRQSKLLQQQQQQQQQQSSSTSSDLPQVPIKEKLETHSELILEPKSEYIEEDMNEDSVEDLTLDDDDVSQMEQEMDHARPGPSHGSGDGSTQGFGGWHMSGNQNQDEVFLAAQEAVGAHRDSQESELENPNTKKRRIKVISVEHIKDNKIVGKLKEELSTHLSFDKIKICKQVNKKIVDKEISLHKISSQSQMKPVHTESESPATKVIMKKNIAASRMEKFLTMTAADCRDQISKSVQLACLNPVLKTPKDTLRCIHCNVLYDPAKKLEHLKVCTKSKPVVPSYGCLQCSFKSISQEDTAQHVRENHK